MQNDETTQAAAEMAAELDAEYGPDDVETAEETPMQELQRRTDEARQAKYEADAADARRRQVLRGSEATGR